MKNPFKKSSIIDTLTNVGIGGAANVAADYLLGMIDEQTIGATTKKAIKVAVGALGGSMVKSKYLRAATDGIAVVGVSELISENLLGDGADNGNGGSGSENGTGGAPFIGMPGQRHFSVKKVRGTGTVEGLPIMSK